jgi:hypothetical protein
MNSASSVIGGVSAVSLVGVVIGGLVSIAVLFFYIWLLVVAIQYLRVVTQAAHRYLDLTASQVGGPAGAWSERAERGPEGRAPGVADVDPPRGYG